MRVVVADTSPVNYLILIDCIDLLRRLFTSVVIPMEVFEELTSAGAPSEVSGWIRNGPDWIEIRSPSASASLPAALTDAELDVGERAVIQIALAENDVLFAGR